jgi:hypothetical protein
MGYYLRVEDLQLIYMMPADIQWCKEQMSVCVPGTSTPKGGTFYKDKIVAELWHGWRFPHA